MSHTGTLPFREANSLHLFGLFCVPFCALACRGTVRAPLTLSVLRMWMRNHFHTTLYFMSVWLSVLVACPSVHDVPDMGRIVFVDCIRWMETTYSFD